MWTRLEVKRTLTWAVHSQLRAALAGQRWQASARVSAFRTTTGIGHVGRESNSCGGPRSFLSAFSSTTRSSRPPSAPGVDTALDTIFL